jgi:hypothetical protein
MLMKTRLVIAALLLLVITPTAFALNPQPEPPSPLRRIPIGPTVLEQINLPVLRNRFVVQPIGVLKQSLGNRQPAQVMSAKTPASVNRPGLLLQIQPKVVAGNPYAQNKGVVLDVFHTVDSATSSSLIVQNVIWCPTLTNNLASQNPETSLAVRIPNATTTPLAEGYFFNLAAGFHTYMLTVGTTVKPELLRVTVNGQTMQGNQLIPNPNTNEVRVFFTYDNQNQSGGHVSVVTWLVYPQPLGYTSSEYFHHFQLAQLD